MKKIVFALLLTSTQLMAATPPAFTPQQEARIRELIRETLVANPGILAEAADAYDKQSQQLQQQMLQQVVAANKDTLFHDAASPRMGAKNARLTMVLFTDYNCPYCKQLDPLLEKIVKTHPDVALILKPLPFRGESSMSAAQHALTVWKTQPDKFWALHQRLMAKKGVLDDASIKAAEQKAGVTPDVSSAASRSEIDQNLMLARKLGVQGTPATLIGDHLVSGAVPYEQLEAIVNAQLEQAGAAK
ncbi:copper resistance protein [Izhakiella australiensis]|uniref:Copper resistance protein n=1 Tax=Izhakiella australiensis TaxID=1926881 RepID=A0A1S8YMJ9_9GAMM|nr:DsbA family protein [Izhakiella australiensis]OON40371.1 copper resistance protein [Izhakiella australiensis]